MCFLIRFLRPKSKAWFTPCLTVAVWSWALLSAAFRRDARFSDRRLWYDQLARHHASTLTLPDVPPEGSLKHIVPIYRKDSDLALAEIMMLV